MVFMCNDIPSIINFFILKYLIRVVYVISVAMETANAVSMLDERPTIHNCKCTRSEMTKPNF